MTVYKNVKVIFEDKIRDMVVVCDGDKIADICERFDDSTADNVIDGKGLYLSPGFVDVHVHGGGGKSAMGKKYEDVIDMAKSHLKFGTTSIVPTTLAAPIERLKSAVLTIKEASEKSNEANILGVHLEGPYLSLQYKGAQSADNILNPDKNPPDEIFDLCDKILMMGAAPEQPGCMALGEKLKEHGIIASIAHSAASYEIAEEAFNHGYSDITHIYSACSSCFKVNLIRVAGVVEAGLSIDGFTTQAIGDLRHLPVGVLKLIYKCKGADKMYLITDGLEFAASKVEENVVYMQENGVEIIYEDGVMRLADRSALAGSVATLSDCVRNMYKTIGVPLYNAVKMASLTPASVIGYGNNKGKIEKGFDADLILFDENINVKSVMTNGNLIF